MITHPAQSATFFKIHNFPQDLAKDLAGMATPEYWPFTPFFVREIQRATTPLSAFFLLPSYFHPQYVSNSNRFIPCVPSSQRPPRFTTNRRAGFFFCSASLTETSVNLPRPLISEAARGINSMATPL